jgi:hypothetical protein
MAWNWESVGPATFERPARLAELLNTRMKALESRLRALERSFTIDGRTETSDTTVTTLKAVAIPVSTTLMVSGHVIARRTGGSSGSAHDGAAYTVEFVAKNTAGTAALIGAEQITAWESQAAWAVTVMASGGNILIRVTGAANNNITWVWVGHTVGVDDRS